METENDKNASDTGDGEDLPSDFFDDFNKAEFMEGLSVIDSWDDASKQGPRINAETIESVKDLRELIGEGKEDRRNRNQAPVMFNTKYKWTKKSRERRSTSQSRLDEFIKPGSRRDPNKTNEAIKKDKEVKVKEYLAKHLDSTDNLRPPGTELDDYFENKHSERKKPQRIEKSPKIIEKVRKETQDERQSRRPLEDSRYPRKRSRERYRNESPVRKRSPRRSPQRFSPFYRPRHSPHRPYIPYSPRRLRNRNLSPKNIRRKSPYISPRRERRSRSPYIPRRRTRTRSRSRSRSRSRTRASPLWQPNLLPATQHSDNFLYPANVEPTPSYPSTGVSYPMQTGPQYPYPHTPAYSSGFNEPYEYGSQTATSGIVPQPVVVTQPVPVPLPVPAPVVDPVGVPFMNPTPPVGPVQVPQPIVNMPTAKTPSPKNILPHIETKTPYDALAQLVADGKLSREDYLKLAPNKGAIAPVDTKTRVTVLTRVQQAYSRLSNMMLPNRMIIENSVLADEPKCLEPKYCSPLRRQAAIAFNFTKEIGPVTTQRNKQLLEAIIASVGLEKVVSRSKKKGPQNMQDAATQTTKPYCDVCEIRESTQCYDVGTCIDKEHFSSAVHTQVVEQDLVKSKSIFNPTGSASDSAPISIAHMTPAQLVSQLAARAKTLKQGDQNPTNAFVRRNPGDYDEYGRGGGQYQHTNFSNYRY